MQNSWYLKDKHTIKEIQVRFADGNMHIKNIYSELELNENWTSANYALVQKEGNRKITMNVLYYNLDMVISVGYRTNSNRTIQFRL